MRKISIECNFDSASLILIFFIVRNIQSDYHQHLTRWLIYISCALNFVASKCWENCRTYLNSLLKWTPAFAHFEPNRWNLQWYYFNICVPFPFQNKENWKCLLATTNVSALCLHFDEVSVILQALYIYARRCSGQVGRWNLIVARGMLKPVFPLVETMWESFCKLHIFLNHKHIRQDQEQNNRVDSF